jgi:hypothetical protein
MLIAYANDPLNSGNETKLPQRKAEKKLQYQTKCDEGRWVEARLRIGRHLLVINLQDMSGGRETLH